MHVGFDDAIALLSRAYPKLSPQLKKTAVYIMERPSEVATLSMRRLARKVGVPPTTLNRLAKALDFGTYEEFRALFLDSINEQPSGYSFAEGQLRVVARESEFDDALNAFQKAAVGSIKTLFDHIDRNALERAVQALTDARTVLVIGMHTSQASADHLHRVADMGFRNWHLLAPESPGFFNLLEDLAPGDVVVCIAVEPCAADSIRVARRAKEAEARVIGITDRRTSPLAACSDDVLLISMQSLSIFPSYVGVMVLLEVLLGMIAARSDRSVADNIDKSKRSRREMGKYWSE